MDPKFNEFLEKLLEDKRKEAQRIIEEAKKQAKEIEKQIEKEAEEFYKNWFEKEKDKLVRKKREIIFETKSRLEREKLEIREQILKNAFERVLNFLKKNPGYIPEKEIVTKKGVEKVKVAPEEYLELLKKQFITDISKVFEE